MARNKEGEDRYRKSRSDMPNTRHIYNYWKKRLREKYNRDIYTDFTCFACLREGYVQRCHIKPLHLKGSNNASNLHLLCPNCHVESEGYLGEIYWTWFENKDITILPIYRSLENGILIAKIAALIKKRMPAKYEGVIRGESVQEMNDFYFKFLESIKPTPEKSKNKQSKLF
jgi:hypothetical protein